MNTQNLHCTEQESLTPTYLYAMRPNKVKESLDMHFEKANSAISWGLFNSQKSYNMCNLDDYKLIKKIVEQSPEQTTFNILDIGAGNFDWINSLANFFNQDTSFANKQFNLFGLNAHGSESVIEKGNTKLHFYGGFKSEEMLKEFEYKGHDLHNDMDLIISRWSLRHMVDPIGTVQQAYSFLRPIYGLMLIDDGFNIEYKNIDGSKLYPSQSQGHLSQFHILSHLDNNILACPSNTGARSYYHFAIQKLSDKIEIPVYYSDFIAPTHYKDAAKIEFTSTIETKGMQVLIEPDCKDLDLSYEACLGSKDLYNWLSDNDLFGQRKSMLDEVELFKYHYCGDITFE